MPVGCRHVQGARTGRTVCLHKQHRDTGQLELWGIWNIAVCLLFTAAVCFPLL